ncbi:rho GTPase-activating protein 30 isoform X2 [Cuculus canorus]|uniref:rho GTPase-activating protein 30 isoform X2 n=1 Tax=Cuculus canorus TaxID=55661 RepID=UPI0023AA5866|nr:rho GTPase-activating protein 30 isoform X2 [Cuculus canorus]
MALALKARHKARRKGGSRERVFGCDLAEHLQRSGQDVPQVLRSCTEFVEQHGVVDGIYRLSGVSSNIQRLRQEFDADRCPDLGKDVFLQDIHCVSSLCKAYFRELPNPLLTYQLYDKFADAVALQMEEARLVKIKEVLKELPPPHYRTLEFLMRHLLRMASYSSRTNMHARNLAIVWAPNLLRSKDIEATGFNGTAAFMEVRVQSIVVEFILTHVEQLFGDAPLHGGEPSRRSLLLGDHRQPPPYHVPAALSQGDGPPAIRPYHTIIELSDHRRKGSLKAKKWRSIFNLGRSSHEAKRKVPKVEEKDDKGGKMSLRPAKSMDSLSSVPFSSDEPPGLSPQRVGKQPPQRRESFDACSTPPECCSVPDQGLEEKLKATEDARSPDSEGENSTKSEPTTPRAGRAALVAPGRSPKGARSRAEKCAGVHISGPFSVTVPFHITSNLSRLTRGQPCPALAGTREPTTHRSTADPEENQHRVGEEKMDMEETRLSLELRDSFAFLDSQEPWLEGVGDGEPDMRSLLPVPGDAEGFLAIEEGMESGFMNPGEPLTEQPASYLSIEECMDEEMFFMAPSGFDIEDTAGDTEEPAGDTDSDEMFLSAHDDLSPLAASLEPLNELPGEGTVPGTSAPPDANSTAVPQDTSPVPCSEKEDATGDGDHPGVTQQEGGGGERDTDGGSSPTRIDSSANTSLRDEAGEDGGPAGAGVAPDVFEEDGEENRADSSPPTPEEAEEGQVQPFLGSPPASLVEEPGEPLVMESVLKAVPAVVPSVVSEAVPGAVPKAVPDVGPGSVLKAVPKVGPDDVPVVVPMVVPDAVPEVVPGSIPKVVPEVVPGSIPEVVPEVVPRSIPEVVPEVVPRSIPEVVPEVVPNAVPSSVSGSVTEVVPGSVSEVVPGSVPEVVPRSIPEVVPEVVLPLFMASMGLGSATTGNSPAYPSLSASAPDLRGAPFEGADPGCPEPAATLRRDGSAPVRLATRTVRVQQARSVPVVPPKPQFARIPPSLHPWSPAAAEENTTVPPFSPTAQDGALAMEGNAAVPRRQPLSPTAQGGRPPHGVGARREGSSVFSNAAMAVMGDVAVPEGPSSPAAGAGARRASWREGVSLSFDAAVAKAAEQHLGEVPVRRMKTYGGEERAPAAARALPFQQAPLRPRRPRPLSCVGVPEGEAAARGWLGGVRLAAQVEGTAMPLPRRSVGTEGKR